MSDNRIKIAVDNLMSTITNEPSERISVYVDIINVLDNTSGLTQQQLSSLMHLISEAVDMGLTKAKGE